MQDDIRPSFDKKGTRDIAFSALSTIAPLADHDTKDDGSRPRIVTILLVMQELRRSSTTGRIFRALTTPFPTEMKLRDFTGGVTPSTGRCSIGGSYSHSGSSRPESVG